MDFDIDKINIRMVKLALAISKKLNFQSMAYDFLYNENGEPEVCEMSWTCPDDMEKCYWDRN